MSCEPQNTILYRLINALDVDVVWTQSCQGGMDLLSGGRVHQASVSQPSSIVGTRAAINVIAGAD